MTPAAVYLMVELRDPFIHDRCEFTGVVAAAMARAFAMVSPGSPRSIESAAVAPKIVLV
jgi:hypothetical protein